MASVASLVGHLLVLRTERRTGVLSVRSASVHTSLYLRAGELVFADEDAHVETLGRMLLRKEALTQAQYDQIIAKMTDKPGAEQQVRFGELAAELGFLTREAVAKALVEQVRWKVMRVFQRPDEVAVSFEPHADGDIVFAPGHPGATLEGALRAFPLVIEELVLDAVRWIDDDLKNELGLFMALGQKLAVRAEERAAIARRFALGRDESDFLHKLDGKRTLGEVLSSSGSIDGPALLTALLLTNVLARADGHAPHPMSVPSVAPASRVCDVVRARRAG
jgi:hypothetical protein